MKGNKKDRRFEVLLDRWYILQEFYTDYMFLHNEQNKILKKLMPSKGSLEEIANLEHMFGKKEAIKLYRQGIIASSINEVLYDTKEEILQMLEESSYISKRLNINDLDAINKSIEWNDNEIIYGDLAQEIWDTYYFNEDIYSSIKNTLMNYGEKIDNMQKWVMDNLNIDNEDELVAFVKYKSLIELDEPVTRQEKDTHILINNYGFSEKKAKLYLESNMLDSETAYFFLKDIEEGKNFYDSMNTHIYGYIEPRLLKDGQVEFDEKYNPPKEIDSVLSNLGFDTKQEFLDYAEFKREEILHSNITL
ncbi:hypothetical protein C0585_01200 [Candidatus Woesearchaeota archaeon]|nr:MAG: hypothetical protein C0585_01200 [Candidatus Woesearchaeota archaeon]